MVVELRNEVAHYGALSLLQGRSTGKERRGVTGITQTEQDQVVTITFFPQFFGIMSERGLILASRFLWRRLPFDAQHFSWAGDKEERFRCHPIIAFVIVGRHASLVTASD